MIIRVKTENNHHDGVDDRQGAEAHQLAHRLDVVGQARHQVAGFGVLEITERQLLQMSENPVAQIGFAAARKAVNIDAPTVAKEPLKRRGARISSGYLTSERGSPVSCSAVSIPPLISQGRAMPAKSVATSERTPRIRKRR